MGDELIWVDDEKSLNSFVRDLALCLSVHRDISPAMVWPDGNDDIVDAIRKSWQQSRSIHNSERNPAIEERLASNLGRLLDCHTESSFVSTPVDLKSIYSRSLDFIFIPITENIFIQIQSRRPDIVNSPLAPAVKLRLRAGEALYVPRRSLFSVESKKASCYLLMLSLKPAEYRFTAQYGPFSYLG